MSASNVHSAIILIVDDVPENLYVLGQLLSEQGYRLHSAPDGARALKFAQAPPPDLILLDIMMPGMDGYTVCERLKADERMRHIPVIFISALNDADNKVKGFEVGGVDYITKPFQVVEVFARIETHLSLYRLRYQLECVVAERTAELQQALEEVRQLKDRLSAENLYLCEEIQQEHNVDHIVGQSKALQYLLFKVAKVAPTDTNVLILGETGSGKELVARAIHRASRRADRPLIKVNCAALPAHLIESELFGHEKGAFTGAAAKRIGRFELAEGATLFLDEIGELPLELQPKLLRVLQDGEFERLGSSQTRRVEVRVIAATNRDLEAEAKAKRFREDLYYRLSAYPLSVPPLRERLDDIPLLAQACVQKFNKKLGTHVDTIPQQTLDALQHYDWPGNIRELENVIERAMIMTADRVLRVELPAVSCRAIAGSASLNEVEREHILSVLDMAHWKISGHDGAAARLGLHPNTLRSRMERLGIVRKPKHEMS